MIDLHTHILPNIDDGSKSEQMSVEMLNMQHEQGVKTVVFTPHFYRSHENEQHFLLRRERSYQQLKEYIYSLSLEKQNKLPKLVLGAEVAWVPNMLNWEELDKFCIENTRYMLLELPTSQWKNNMFNQIYDLMSKKDIIPVIAHLERYFKIQSSDMIDEILAFGIPIQLSSGAFLSFLSARRLCKMIKNFSGFVIASDCHNITSRMPNLASGFSVIERKLGSGVAKTLDKNSYNILNDAR